MDALLVEILVFALILFAVYRYKDRKEHSVQIKPRLFGLDDDISEEEELLLEEEQDAQELMDLLYLDEDEDEA